MLTVAATAWPRILLVYGGGVLAATQLGIISPIADTLQRELTTSLTMIALVTSVPTLVGAVAGAMVGVWVERLGHARSLSIGLAIMAVTAASGAAAGDGPALLVLRGLLGFGYLMVVSAAPSLMARLASPAHQPVVLSLWGTFVPIGLALAAALASLFVADVGWRGYFWIDAALLGGMGVAIAVVTRGDADRHARMPAARLRHLRAPLLLAAAFFCFAWVFLAVTALLPAHLTATGGWTVAQAGWLLAVTTTGGAAGSLLAGVLMRRGMSLRWLAGIGLLLPAAASLAMFADDVPTAGIATGTSIYFLAGGLVPAVAFAAVPRLAPDSHALGPINGLLAQFGSLGSLTGPPALALWVDWAGWMWAPLPVAAMSVVGLACLWGAFPADPPAVAV